MTITSLSVIAPSTAMPGGPPGIQGPPGTFVLFGVNNQMGLVYAANSSDTGKIIIFSGQTMDVSFLLAPMIGVTGWWAVVKNKNFAGKINVTVTGATIDGQATMTIDTQCSAQIVFTGLNFETFGPSDGGLF
jgi:hypothetical protein